MSLSFSDRELDVLTVLWDLGEGSVADVQKRLPADLAYNTVLSVLRTLERKGYVGHRRGTGNPSGRPPHVYHPRVTRERAGRSMLRRLLDTAFRHSAALLVSQLVAERKLSPEERARIQASLESRPRKRRRKP